MGLGLGYQPPFAVIFQRPGQVSIMQGVRGGERGREGADEVLGGGGGDPGGGLCAFLCGQGGDGVV